MFFHTPFKIIFMRLFSIVYFLLSITIFTKVCAQDTASWYNYTFSQRVLDVEVHDNTVWVATYGGLVKYDINSEKKTFFNRANSNLPDNNIASIAFDRDSNIWIGSMFFGIGKFNGKWCTNYYESNSGLPSNQLNTKVTSDIDNNIWVGSMHSIAKYKNNIWKTWEIGNQTSSNFTINDILSDSRGVVWVATSTGLGKIENNKYNKVSEIIGEAYCLVSDKNNNIWIGTSTGLYSFNGFSYKKYNTSNSAIPINRIVCITVDSNNNLWFPGGTGLVKYNHSEFELTNQDMAGIFILCISSDDNNKLWCGTFTGELIRVDEEKFSRINMSNSPLKNNYVTDLVCNDTAIFIGTKNNLVVKSDNQFYPLFNSNNQISKTYISKLTKGLGNEIWSAFGVGDTCLLKMCNNGVVIFDPTNSPFYPNNTVFSDLTFDSNNNFWISTYNGLFKYADGFFSKYLTNNSGLPSNTIFCLFSDNANNLWGGTDNGLFKFDGVTWQVWNKLNSDIPTNVVNSITGDSNSRIWFSCMDEGRLTGDEYGGGLTLLNQQSMQTFNKSNSDLPSNTIFDICTDSLNNIWIGTCWKGLVKFDGSSNWNIYNVFNSGLSHDDISKILIRDNQLWIGHSKGGVSVVDIKNIDKDIRFQIVVDEKKNNSIMLFPNPVNVGFNIKIADSTIIPKFLKVFDSGGKLISLKEISSNLGSASFFISLNEIKIFQNGIYVIQINTNNANYSYKIIVNK